MLTTPAQYRHFAVPSNATTVSLDRSQFVHFQIRNACSITWPAFFADTGDGRSFAWWIRSVGGNQNSKPTTDADPIEARRGRRRVESGIGPGASSAGPLAAFGMAA
jgi:hypothetical protein